MRISDWSSDVCSSDLFKASGINATAVATEFAEHATEEQQHADQICARIVQLGGKPNLSPDGLLSRSHSDYVEGEDIVEMLQEDLVAERIAIDSYREIIDYLGRSEENTSELQSLMRNSHAVFCLKKKKKIH